MKVLPFRTMAECQAAAVPALAHLQGGGILGYPTETVYGLGCALADAPLERLAALKGGRSEKSFLLLVGSVDQIEDVTWTPSARKLAAAFWPGPLTIALQADATRFPARVLGSNDTVAVRLTGHAVMRQLLDAFGQPITSTSANLPGQPPARNAQEVASVLTGLDDLGSLILDAGLLPPAAPSTLVDCSVEPPRLIRAGAITLEALTRIVHDVRA
jgi:L-threonylcarbamoyladenylate synthase